MQKRRICCDNCKYALDERFHGHFCPRRKPAKSCHPGMHISGTPPSLPINCLYVCLVPILASGICFVHSSRHLVCIIARHTAFGDICQQHRESSFLLIFRAFFMLPVATPDVCFGVSVGNGMLTAVFDKYFLENISFNFL